MARRRRTRRTFRDQPLSPPVLMPPTRYFEPKRYRSIGGTIIRVAAAMMVGQLITKVLLEVYMKLVIRAMVSVRQVSLLM